MIDLVLLIVALVCWAIAAIGQPTGRVNLVAAGLFFAFLRELLP
jgi:hypothetical protein